MRRTLRNSNRGFTLIELLVTLIVLSIIIGIALPNFNDMIRNNRSVTLGEEFQSALNFARSEAAKRGGLVSICASNNEGTACGSDWTNGWLAFVDTADETSGAVAVGEVLRYWEPLGDNLTLTVNRDGDVDFVRFNAQGGLSRNSTDPVRVLARHDQCTSDSARELRVGPSGSVSSRRAEC